jgi:hypothetical protein
VIDAAALKWIFASGLNKWGEALKGIEGRRGPSDTLCGTVIRQRFLLVRGREGALASVGAVVLSVVAG